MKKIIGFVEAVFKAKAQFGGNSEEFKAAQSAALEEIDRSYDYGAEDIIRVEKSEILPPGIGIKINKKKITPSDHCSFVLTKLPTDEPKD
jgi:hypothetical protein